MDKLSSGINGFGRFGQHLLKFWIENINQSNFKIDYINDPNLSLEEAYQILITDKYYGNFYSKQVSRSEDGLLINGPDNKKHFIKYTNSTNLNISWLGKPYIFFECSGLYTNESIKKNIYIGNTKLIIISATSNNSDQMLIYGYNHHEFTERDEIISYGSCTINAYIPFASFINSKYGVKDSDVHVIHNVPEHLLSSFLNPKRKICTLEDEAPKLVDFINQDNFSVTYTLIPYSGVSLMDIRFRLRENIKRSDFISDLREELKTGKLKKLYSISKIDMGPEYYKFSEYSADIIESGIKIINDNLYIQAYFDNENSVNRFYDLAQYITNKIQS